MNEKLSSLAIPTAVNADAHGIPESSFSERRSGGPKTPAGKRRSAMNALRSGLYSDAVLVKGEDRDEYLRFARAIVAGLDVQTPLEMAMAERVVSALWRSRRARRYEAAHLNALANEAELKRESLRRAEETLAERQRAYRGIMGFAYAERVGADEVGAAAGELYEMYREDPDAVYHEDVDDPEPPSHFWSLFPERAVSKKRAVAIATEVFKIFCGSRPGMPPGEFWTWALGKVAAREHQAKKLRDDAAVEYRSAMQATFILDKVRDGSGWAGRTVDAGRTLADAEARLDRQVSRAIADLKAVRELRGPGSLPVSHT